MASSTRRAPFRTLGVLVALGSVAALGLTGCAGASGEADGRVTLNMQTGMQVASAEYKQLKTLSTDYEKSHSDVTIKLAPAGTNYKNQLSVMLAARNFPDIFMTTGWSKLRYAQFLVPLQNESWAKYLSPQLKQAMEDKKGRLWAMPTNVDVSGLMYNETVLQKAGVDPSSIRTWDDFTAAARKTAELDGVSPIYVGGKDMAAAVMDRTVNGAYDDAELRKMKSGTFVAKPYEQALDLLAGWKSDGLLNPDYSSATSDTMAKAFAADQAAFELGPSTVASNAASYNPDVKLGFIPAPAINGSEPYVVAGERTAFGVTKASPHQTEAKAFLAYLAQPENETAMAAASACPVGLTNATTKTGPLSASYEKWVSGGKAKVESYFDRVYMPDGAFPAMGVSADAVFTGQSSPAAATSQMAATYKTLSAQK